MSGKSARRIALCLSLAVVVSGLGLAWSAHRRQAYLKELEVQVRGWGGEVYRCPNSNPAWDSVRRILGRQFVDSVVGFDGYSVEGPMNRQADPGQLAQLLEFQPIRYFDAMSGSNLGDDWIGRISDTRSVRSLSLRATSVTDRSVPKFLEMKNLTDLYLEYSKVSDAGVDRLLDLPKLQRLDIGGPNIHSIRLVDVWPTDVEGRPENLTGLAGGIKGRIAVAPHLGRPFKIEMSAYQPDSPGSFAGYDRSLEEVAPGVFAFDFVSKFLHRGRTEVRLVVRVARPGRKAVVSRRLMASIEVEAPEPDGEGSPLPPRP